MVKKLVASILTVMVCALALAANQPDSNSVKKNDKASKQAMCGENGACSQLDQADGNSAALQQVIKACQKVCGTSS